MLKKVVLILCLIISFYCYSNEPIPSYKDNIILIPNTDFKLIYYEKRPYGVYDFYSEFKDKYGTYIEKEGIYSFYKYSYNDESETTNEKIISYYKNIIKELHGTVHYIDSDSIVFEVNNLWININLNSKSYDILIIEVVDIKNEFYTSQEIRNELFTNGRVILKLIEFDGDSIKLDSVNQLVEIVKFLLEFETINIKMCYYDYESKTSIKNKSEIIKEYFTTFDVDDNSILVIQKDNIYKRNGLVLFY